MRVLPLLDRSFGLHQRRHDSTLSTACQVLHGHEDRLRSSDIPYLLVVGSIVASDLHDRKLHFAIGCRQLAQLIDWFTNSDCSTGHVRQGIEAERGGGRAIGIVR